MDNERVTYFARTDHRNKDVEFGIKAKDRTRHVYVIGKTGMGKSTLLENMAIQDIQRGNGIAFLDPHGSTAEKLLEYIPEERVDDVLYFAPFDVDHPISFNVMEDVGEDKRHLVLDGLMSAFKKIWIDAWSSRMEYILGNTILALLEYPGTTMLDINRMYTDKDFRKKVVDYVQDPLVKSFWEEEFASYTDRYAQEATPAIQNKVGQFTSNPLIRNIIGQPKSSFDIRDIMDKRKIIIINLSKGLVGEQNANLLGSMLITKIYLAAMSRADSSPEIMSTLPNFYLYVDEFQSFANESFANILSEARKYKLNLTIAHQYIEQMSEEVRAAVFGNVGTMISFRVGAYDAEILEKEFAPQFTAEDMVNLGFAQVYLKLMVDGISSTPFSATTMPPIEEPRISYRDVAIAHSRKNFGTPRSDVESTIKKSQEKTESSHSERIDKGKAPRQDKKPNYKKETTQKEKAPREETPKETKNNDKPKVGDENHRNSLREALKNLTGAPEPASPAIDEKMKSDQVGNKEKIRPPKETKDKEKKSEQKPLRDNRDSFTNNNSESLEKTNEIPKNKLKKILRVDEDYNNE
ncbi:MAG: type IV secretion system DNA-binding domain-containing protein [Candidatus Campbellbacteria bacterium]|nr:type IV secretion system DNA-binding domain-containing protein [Candidatus Campbellbacteria bacterium]